MAISTDRNEHLTRRVANKPPGSILKENQPWDATELATGLKVPVHVLAADPHLDPAFTAQDGAALQQLNPNWTWEIVSGASHSVHRDAPQLVIDRLLGRT